MDECGKVTSDLGEAIFVTGTALSYSPLATGKSQIALVIFFSVKGIHVLSNIYILKEKCEIDNTKHLHSKSTLILSHSYIGCGYNRHIPRVNGSDRLRLRGGPLHF